MGDTVASTMLVSEIATLGRDLESEWGRTPRSAERAHQLATEIASKAQELRYELTGFSAPTPAAAAA